MKYEKVLCVFGTRPEAIKLAPLLSKIDSLNPKPNIKVCVTAQHRRMLDLVIEIFNIKVDYDLDLMKQQQSLYDITSNVLSGLRDILAEFKPDLVIVQGDTSTTFATSLACFYEKIPVAHVEAGLRTNNIYSPWPEELNRQLVSRIARYHFAPTEKNRELLIREYIDPGNIYVTGNTVVDALFMIMAKIENDTDFRETLAADLLSHNIDITRKFILVTGHRRENFGNRFVNICNALKRIADNNPDLNLVYPVHLNPNVLNPTNEILKPVKNIHLTEPLKYDSFIYLMSKSYLILTDSGGIQEEAPSLDIPVLVMRETTEREEAIASGTCRLVGTEENNIVHQVQNLIDNKSEYRNISKSANPFGDGNACDRIISVLFKNN